MTPAAIKGLLVDLDGTLYIGDEPVAGARDALWRLEDAGIAIRYVTNTTRRPRRDVCENLHSLGFEVGEAEVFTPARAAAALIWGKSCFPLVDETLFEDLGDAVFTDDSPDYVLVGDFGEGFTYARLDDAFRCLMDGAELLALQKNRYWLEGGALHLDAGPFVATLEYATGKQAAVVGKPERSFFDLALREMGLEAEQAAMIGDDAGSDVAGAKMAGLGGFLVKTGKYSPGDEETGDPDLLLTSFAELPDVLGL